jgi:hypothetical protein
MEQASNNEAKLPNLGQGLWMRSMKEIRDKRVERDLVLTIKFVKTASKNTNLGIKGLLKESANLIEFYKNHSLNHIPSSRSKHADSMANKGGFPPKK